MSEPVAALGALLREQAAECGSSVTRLGTLFVRVTRHGNHGGVRGGSLRRRHAGAGIMRRLTVIGVKRCGRCHNEYTGVVCPYCTQRWGRR